MSGAPVFQKSPLTVAAIHTGGVETRFKEFLKNEDGTDRLDKNKNPMPLSKKENILKEGYNFGVIVRIPDYTWFRNNFSEHKFTYLTDTIVLLGCMG